MDDKTKELILNRDFKEVALANTFVSEVLASVTKYQRKLFLLLVNEAQPYVKGQRLDDSFDVTAWASHSFTFKISALLNDGSDENYTNARRAIQGLMKKSFPFSFGETRNLTGEVNFLNGYIYEPGTGEITVSLDEIVWAALFNFASGFQFVDLYVCLMCDSFPSLYFYSLIYDQDSITVGIDTLKKRLNLTGKYKNASDFIKNVVEPAKKELDRISPRSFTYEIEKDETKRGKPIKNVVLKAKSIPKNMPTSQLKKMAAPAYRFSVSLRKLLKEKVGFDDKGIGYNIQLLSSAEEKMGTNGFEDFIRSITPGAVRADNPVGYTINAIKKHLGELPNEYIPPKENPTVPENSSEEKRPTGRDLDKNTSSIGDILGNLF